MNRVEKKLSSPGKALCHAGAGQLWGILINIGVGRDLLGTCRSKLPLKTAVGDEIR